MSHIPAIVAQIGRAAREAAETFEIFAGIHRMSAAALPSHPDHVPLSSRSSHELRARASELKHMAAMARTAQVRTALETLAARFAALAAKRELAEVLDPRGDDAGE